MPIGIYQHKKGKDCLLYGKQRSEETIRKIIATKNKRDCHHSLETKIKIGASHTGEKSINWMGDDVGYDGVHKWVKKHLGKPTKCEHCGKSGVYIINKDGKRKLDIEWANKDHRYRRNLSDWMRLCKKCHGEHDVRFGLRQRINNPSYI
jgi:hypothetical protein